MKEKKKYAALSLPETAVQKLKNMKLAHSFSTGKLTSYEEVITVLIESVEKTNPALYSVYLNVSSR